MIFRMINIRDLEIQTHKRIIKDEKRAPKGVQKTRD